MEITFLGTSAGVPSKQRNVSSLALNLTQEKEGFWLFDCGEATQHQIQSTTVRPPKINKIFLTHLHGDHVFGIFGLLATVSAMGHERGELEIIAPKGVQEMISTVMKITKTYVTYKIKYTTIEDGMELDMGEFKVKTKKLDHDIESFAFRIEQADLDGVLDSEKAKALGVPFGKEMGMLKNGLDVTLADGTVIKSSDVLGEKRKGKVITIFGDTKYHENFVDFAKDSDVLIYEGTLTPEDKEKAPKIKHSTYVDGVNLAKGSNAKQLLINHVSSRYVGADLIEFQREFKKLFTNGYVVNDFDTFKV